MNRINAAEARQFAEQKFPHAPEQLAAFLNIAVRYSPLNCDGWFLQAGERSIIRVNSSSPEARQQFTLAHELGHLILGVPTVIGESQLDGQASTSREEQQVNDFAGDILLPLSQVNGLLPEIPVTAAVIKRIAKRSRVSELFVARRLAFLAKDLGLKDGLVIFYKNGVYEWQWSSTVEASQSSAQDFLSQCLQASPNPVRIHREEQNDVIVASLVENPALETITVFVQVVAEAEGLKELHEEATRRMAEFIFGNAGRFQPSVQGCFSAIKPKVQNLSLDEAVQLFNHTYLNDPNRWDSDLRARLNSAEGQRYIRMRLRVWVGS